MKNGEEVARRIQRETEQKLPKVVKSDQNDLFSPLSGPFAYLPVSKPLLSLLLEMSAKMTTFDPKMATFRTFLTISVRNGLETGRKDADTFGRKRALLVTFVNLG